MSPLASQHVLIASGLGTGRGGGIYAIGNVADAIDHLPTTGLAVSLDGTRLARALFDPEDDPQASGEITRYDRRGSLMHQRVDELREAHMMLWEHDGLLVVSTLENSVLRIDDAGRVTGRWSFPGKGDCWHINGVVRHQGRLLGCAFGRFDEHRGWAAPGARDGTGIVFDLESGEDVLTGFSAPHDPTPVDEGWFICNSGSRELLRLDHAGAVTGRVQLGGWTRGLTYDDDAVYVGVSARRGSAESSATQASIVVLDRETLAERSRVAVGCPEVFSLKWVDPALVEGVRIGWAASPASRFAIPGSSTAPPAPPREIPDHRLLVTVEPPEAAPAGSPIAVQYTATNRGRVTIYNAGPDMAVVAGAWETLDGQPAGSEARARLIAPILPGESITGTLRLTAPVVPGAYRLRVAALQEGFVWFDALDATLGGRYDISIDASVGAAVDLDVAPGTGGGREADDVALAIIDVSKGAPAGPRRRFSARRRAPGRRGSRSGRRPSTS